jgi:hypothetical protein
MNETTTLRLKNARSVLERVDARLRSLASDTP